MKVIVIEDEAALAESIAESLLIENYSVDVAFDFPVALDKISMTDYDCVLLDLSLPGGSGLTLLKKLKEMNKHNGVIIISAKDSLDDKILGLKLGADDYLAKPFHTAELVARVGAVVRRRTFGGDHTLVYHEIKIDTAGKSVFIHDREIALTRKEYDLLLFLVTNKHRVVSKEAIAEHLTGDQADLLGTFDFIYSHVKNLKKKIAEAGGKDYIKAIYGLGYKFTA